jgi:hypothetical protein
VLGTDTVVDLKTTNARTQAEFEGNALRFEYDRQLAFYADSVCARKMVLIGISKKYPKCSCWRPPPAAALPSGAGPSTVLS